MYVKSHNLYCYYSSSIHSWLCVQIVRDFALNSFTPTLLQNRQRSFVEQLLKNDATGTEGEAVQEYSREVLGHHVSSAVAEPLVGDKLTLP